MIMAKKLVSPEVCVHQHEGKRYEIHVKLPGVKKEDIDLRFSRRGFCVEGTRGDTIFSGCYTLENSVDLNRVKTKFYDVEGLVEITAPIVKAVKSKKIRIG
jgi:HSP20 family molecular chaperone IbpA